jgi:uncharacterized protein (TIGR02147 family)
LDYRTLLRDRLKKKSDLNPRYSMRAFARDINLSPSRLSDILKGKQGLSKKKALDVCQRLELTADETARFLDSVEALHSKIPQKANEAADRLAALTPDPDQLQIASDSFAVISNWYHLAIVQLAELKGFDPSPAWVASALKISSADAAESIERLLRLGILVADATGFHVQERFISVTEGKPSDAVKQFHKQILSLALESIEGQTVAERDLSAAFIPLRAADLDSLRETIKSFRRNVGKTFSSAEGKDALYCLSVQLFKVGP